jgi:hypothetical protein
MEASAPPTAAPGPRVQSLTLPRYFLGWHSLLERCQRRYGDVFRIRDVRWGPVVVIADPEAIRTVLADTDSAIAGPIRSRNGVEDLVSGATVPFLDGDAHVRRRRALLPRFYAGEALAAYERTIVEIIDHHVETWSTGDVIRVSELARRLSADMVVRVLFGIHDPALVADSRTLVPRLIPAWALARMVPQPLRSERLAGPWRTFVRLKREIHALIEDQIAARRGPGTRSGDLCSLLVAANAGSEVPLTDEEIRDELLVAALGSTHSTAIALAWVFDCALHDPRTLERLAADPDDSELYDAVVEEALRLRELSDSAPRVLTRDVSVCGVPLRAGEVVFPSTYLVHRNPRLYDRPHEFLPDRFIGRRPSSYAWLPFGSGSHRCIGARLAQLQMRVVLREVLRRWEVRPVRSRPSRARRAVFFWAPAGGVKMRVVARAGCAS